jgi:hypothetical protein
MLKKKDGPSQADWTAIISSAWLGEPEGIAIVGKPEVNFVVAKGLDLKPTVYELVGYKLVDARHSNWLLDHVTEYCRKLSERQMKTDSPILHDSSLRLIKNNIIAGSATIKESDIYPFDYKDGERYCFKRLDFTPDAELETPLFDSILERIETDSMRENLMGFIGAVFDDNHPFLEKFIWFYGEGSDGKGSLFSLLAGILGNASTSFFGTKKNVDKHFTASFVGKRFAFCPDLQNVNLVKTDEFKTLTGDTMIPVRRMGEATAMADNRCMIAIGSNNLPNIQHEFSLRRRALFVRIVPREGTTIDYTFKKRLQHEAPGILGKCIQSWNDCLKNKQGILASEQSIFDELAEENTETIANVFYQTCNLVTGGIELTQKIYSVFSQKIPGFLHDFYGQNDLAHWLKATHGVTKERMTVDGKKIRVFKGVQVKQMPFDDVSELPKKF